TLTSTSTGAVREWNTVDEFNVEEKFNVGAYTLEASFGTRGEEGFGKPYYYGVTSLTVSENKTTTVALTASLANSMISIKYTDGFTSYFGDYSVSVKSLAGKEAISYSKFDSEPVYVNPGNVELGVNVVKPNGRSLTIPVSIVAKAKYHHNVTLDVNGGNVGEAELVIVFDDTMDKETISIDLSQDLENIAEPTVTADGFAESPVDIIAGCDPENPLTFTVKANGGIAKAVLETRSTTLLEKGWPGTVDLMATPAATGTTMTALGFSETGMWHNPDKMAVLDFTKVVPNIPYKDGINNQSTFTLTVTDRLSQESNVVTLTVNVEKLEVEVVSNETLPYYETNMTFGLAYNGADPENRIAAEYKDHTGTWKRLAVGSITAKSRAMMNYVVNVSGLPSDAVYGERDVLLRVLALNDKGTVMQTSPEWTVVRQKVPFSFTVNENDVFALRASGLVAHDEKPVADFVASSTPVLEMSTDGGANYSEYNYTVDGDRLKIEGLKSSTAYTARLKADGMNCRPVTFTTEAERQLPNAGMNEWYKANGVTSNQIWYYPWSQGSSVMAWNTYNPVTMSQGKTTLQYNYAYDATSGTVFTDDSKSGSAAQIRTVGWGGGNTASGSLPTSGNRWKFGTCKYVSAGQLFLGNWENVNPEQNAIPNYGIDFASRPSSMTFWYKYAVMNRNGNDNGQKGVAIIQILDGNGNIISEKTELLDVNASYNNLSADTDYSVGGVYAEYTIPLEYPINAYKASRIVVTFKSSQLTNSELENLKNQDNMRPPRPMNLNNHEYLGSSLLIDDITLNY
ncbi:MAG: DUF4493 domain-containing protein, partial [Muribaculaceae bacterium]|nr:DUF4493 domain-containing protein [Muribaculaceae bacterium]